MNNQQNWYSHEIGELGLKTAAVPIEYLYFFLVLMILLIPPYFDLELKNLRKRSANVHIFFGGQTKHITDKKDF